VPENSDILAPTHQIPTLQNAVCRRQFVALCRRFAGGWEKGFGWTNSIDR
jgi:hypothetical protein